MSDNHGFADIRRVSGFDRVVLRAQHENELIITQGEQEALTVHGPADIVPRIETEVRQGTLVISMGGGLLEKLGDALTTSLTRPHIRYELAVKSLASLEVCAMASIRADSLKSEHLALRFAGVGELHIGAVDTHLLEVDLPGAARIELAGYAAQQRVTVAGPAQYDASRLESRKAQVTVKGIGAATVWAEDQLDVTIRGPGRVSYRGAPRVKHSIAPMGSLSCLGTV